MMKNVPEWKSQERGDAMEAAAPPSGEGCWMNRPAPGLKREPREQARDGASDAASDSGSDPVV